MSRFLSAMMAAQDSIVDAHRQAWADNAEYLRVDFVWTGYGHSLSVLTDVMGWLPIESAKRNGYSLRTCKRDLSLPSGQTHD